MKLQCYMGPWLLRCCCFVVLTLHHLKQFSITHLAILDVFQGDLMQNESGWHILLKFDLKSGWGKREKGIKGREKERDLVINYFIHIQLCRCMWDQ